MLATIPFWMVLIKFVIRAEDRQKVLTLVALVPGLAGVALFMLPAGPQYARPIEPGMALILLAAAFLWALGSIVSQRQMPSIPAAASAGMQLLCGGAVLLIVSLLNGELAGFSLSQISPLSWAGLAYLTLAGSVVAFTAYVWLLSGVQAQLVATYTFVNPIVAVGLGWAVLGEHLTLLMLAGFILVIASVVWVWRLQATNTQPSPSVSRSSLERRGSKGGLERPSNRGYVLNAEPCPAACGAARPAPAAAAATC